MTENHCHFLGGGPLGGLLGSPKSSIFIHIHQCFFSDFPWKKNNHFYWGYPHDLGTPPLSKSSWKHHFRGGLPWPSGNQTWHWKLPCVDHWFIKSSTYSGFPVAMFDYRRVYGTVAPCQDPEFPFAIDENIIYMGSNNIAMFDMMTLWGISWCFRGTFHRSEVAECSFRKTANKRLQQDMVARWPSGPSMGCCTSGSVFLPSNIEDLTRTNGGIMI